jgi:hypothetical protein
MIAFVGTMNPSSGDSPHYRIDLHQSTTLPRESSPEAPQGRMRRLYPAGLKRPKDEEYRQSNHRPSYQHGSPVQHRDIMTRICAWDKSAIAATAVKRPEKITFTEMRSPS